MGHTESSWEEAENCPKCNEITLFFMEEYDGEQGGTCQKCETSYQFIQISISISNLALVEIC